MEGGGGTESKGVQSQRVTRWGLTVRHDGDVKSVEHADYQGGHLLKHLSGVERRGGEEDEEGEMMAGRPNTRAVMKVCEFPSACCLQLPLCGQLAPTLLHAHFCLITFSCPSAWAKTLSNSKSLSPFWSGSVSLRASSVVTCKGGRGRGISRERAGTVKGSMRKGMQKDRASSPEVVEGGMRGAKGARGVRGARGEWGARGARKLATTPLLPPLSPHSDGLRRPLDGGGSLLLQEGPHAAQHSDAALELQDLQMKCE